MCEVCKCGFGHLQGCPEAPPEKGIYTCYECGDVISDGEKYYEADGNKYCECCVQDIDTEEALKLFGIEAKIASVDWEV